MLTAADISLLLSALALGASGAWHCTAMCGAICSTAEHWEQGRVIPVRPAAPVPGLAEPQWKRWAAFLSGRSLSYAIAGSAVAVIGAWMASHQASSGILRMVWAMAHALALVYGLYVAATARQPAWLLAWTPASRRLPLAWRSWGQGRWAVAGLLWGLIPCGLLQSALLLGALASGPVAGAAVLWTFAAASTPGLLAWPMLQRWAARLGARQAEPTLRAVLLRFSGALLALAAAWSLVHGVWQASAEVC